LILGVGSARMRPANAGIANVGTIAIGPPDAVIRTVDVDTCGRNGAENAALIND
jgi:hypothetical protein